MFVLQRDLLYVRAFEGRAIGGLCPENGVFDHPLHVFVVVDRVGLVPGLEVEDAAVAAIEAQARTEHLTARIGGHKNGLVGLGDVEGLAVGLLVRDFKVAVDALCDRMRGLCRPEQLIVAVLSPGEVAARSHQKLEGL